MSIAIVLAGGVGSRTGLDIPKQFLKINDKEIIAYTLESFQNASKIEKIVIVSLKDYFDEIKLIVERYNISKFAGIVENGSTRQKSVFNALKYLETLAKEDDIVLIHDGIRAMVSSKLIDKCVEETKIFKATTLAQKSLNTIVYSEDNNIEKFIDRNFVYNVQTPQSFEYKLIYDSHKKATNNEGVTDDTQIAMLNGYKVHIIQNDEPNLKLTTKQDIAIFEYYLGNKN